MDTGHFYLFILFIKNIKNNIYINRGAKTGQLARAALKWAGKDIDIMETNNDWIVKNKDIRGFSFNTRQTATILECNERTVRKWIASGKLPASRTKNGFRINYEDIRYFAEKHRGMLILPGKEEYYD